MVTLKNNYDENISIAFHAQTKMKMKAYPNAMRTVYTMVCIIHACGYIASQIHN